MLKFILLFNAENLTPSELKKMRNKQRKAQKKAALEKQKQKEEQQKKEQQSKKQADGDLDGPKEEELNPDKLARVSGKNKTNRQTTTATTTITTKNRETMQSHCSCNDSQSFQLCD